VGQLDDYLTAADHPFEWGRHDCLTFANGWAALNGKPFGAAWLGHYRTPLQAAVHAARICRNGPHDDIYAGIDAALDRAMTLHPSDGMIAAQRETGPLGWGLGIVRGGAVIRLGASGIEAALPQAGDVYWSLG